MQSVTLPLVAQKRKQMLKMMEEAQNSEQTRERNKVIREFADQIANTAKTDLAAVSERIKQAQKPHKSGLFQAGEISRNLMPTTAKDLAVLYRKKASRDF